MQFPEPRPGVLSPSVNAQLVRVERNQALQIWSWNAQDTYNPGLGLGLGEKGAGKALCSC